MVLFLGLAILFLSISRASLRATMLDEKENELRKIPVKIVIRRVNQPSEIFFYKLPEVRTLPTSPWYGIKEIRDFLWLYLSQEGEEKIKVGLLLADKKASEARVLLAFGKEDEAIRAMTEALNKLEKVEQDWQKMDKKNFNKKGLAVDIYLAGLAYETEIKKVNRPELVDKVEYKKIVESLREWNEKQEEKKY